MHTYVCRFPSYALQAYNRSPIDPSFPVNLNGFETLWETWWNKYLPNIVGESKKSKTGYLKSKKKCFPYDGQEQYLLFW